jgi:cysteine desulfuration protein SufE
MTLPHLLMTMLQDLQAIADPRQKYEYLLKLAKLLPDFPKAAMVPENKVVGCVSQVYITVALRNNAVFLQGDSDSQISKGFVAFLIQGLNGLPVQEFCQIKPDFIKLTGLEVSLAPSRHNGLYNIFSAMQQRASKLAAEIDEGEA